MLQKGVLIGIVLALVAWFVYSKVENDRRREVEQAEAQQFAQVTRQEVDSLSKAYGASQDWVKVLSNGEAFRLTPILTIELERAWIKYGPIVFPGSIEDIKTLDAEHYEVVIYRELFAGISYMFNTKLKLSLRADKGIIDDFINAHPNIFDNVGFNNGVAVAANINDIKSSEIAGEEADIIDVKTGVGELLGIVYTKDFIF